MFFIRTEGSPKIGTGHLVRCMSIARALLKYTDVVFLCSLSDSINIIKENGFEAIQIPAGDFSKEEVYGIIKIAKTLCVSEHEDKSCILVDSYDVSEQYFENLRTYFFVAYMDDLVEKPYMVDVCINYNGYADEDSYKKLYGKKQPAFLLGSKYAPLRSEFSKGTDKQIGEVKNILITAGGSDYLNLSKVIALGLIKKGIEAQINIVCGRLNPHIEALKLLEREYNNIKLHINVADMASLMKETDLAISAGGSTCYELCALGVPFVVFSYVDNQKGIVKWASENDIALSAGDVREYDNLESASGCIADMVSDLIYDDAKRKLLSGKSRDFVDGNGAARLADKIIKLWEDLK